LFFAQKVIEFSFLILFYPKNGMKPVRFELISKNRRNKASFRLRFDIVTTVISKYRSIPDPDRTREKILEDLLSDLLLIDLRSVSAEVWAGRGSGGRGGGAGARHGPAQRSRDPQAGQRAQAGQASQARPSTTFRRITLKT